MSNSSNCMWSAIFEGQPENIRWWITVTGIFSAMLSIWVSVAIVRSKLRKEDVHYRNLLNYTVASSIRRGVPSFYHLFQLSTVERSIVEDRHSCAFYAFWENMILAYEIESIVQICTDLCVKLWHKKKDNKPPRWLNKVLSAMSLGLAVFYSTMPILGFGEYSKDIACTYCSLNPVLHDVVPNWNGTVTVLFLLQYLKPTIVVIMTQVSFCIYNKEENESTQVMWYQASVALGFFYLSLNLLTFVGKISALIYQYKGLPFTDSFFVRILVIGAYLDSCSGIVGLLTYLNIDVTLSEYMLNIGDGRSTTEELKEVKDEKKE